jgi:hypothetical protein
MRISNHKDKAESQVGAPDVPDQEQVDLEDPLEVSGAACNAVIP